VLNNPLSMTDPTGFSWWTKWRKTVFSVVAAIAVPWALTELFMANATVGGALAEIGAAEIISVTTTGKAVAAMAGGFAAGGISGGNIQSALQGAFTAALTFGVGELSGAHAAGGTAAMNAGQRVGQIAGHAAVGCASHAAAGGSCKAGAMSAGFSALAGHVPGISDTGLIGRMAVGAIAAKAGGGKAENGAMSAAFEYLFNDRGGDIGRVFESVLYRPLSVFGYSHAFVVATDPYTGEQQYLGGFPTGDGPSIGGLGTLPGLNLSVKGSWGRLEGFSNRYDASIGPDFDTGGTGRISFSTKDSMAAVRERMTRYADATNRLDLDYDPINKNSNAYAHGYMRQNGYAIPKAGAWAPGWNTCLKQGSC
jgi:hypothetical protein